MKTAQTHHSDILSILGLIIGSPKYLVSCVLTFLSLPFIAIAHRTAMTKALKLINAINNADTPIPIIPQQNPAASQTTVSVLRHLRAQGAAPRRFDIITHKDNFSELVKDQNGKTTGFTLYIDFPHSLMTAIGPAVYSNDVVDAFGNIIHRAGDTCYTNPSVTFIESQLNADQLKAMKAIRKLNIGGVQTLIEAEEKAGKSGLTL